ncbi:MAG: sigma-70 family RNA polymerase sigma factor [Myxococcales bacterium]
MALTDGEDPIPAVGSSERTVLDCYASYRSQVYLSSLRYGGGRKGWAEDLTQDVFVKLLELGNLEGIDDVGAWLHTVTANLAVSRLRRERSFVGKLRQWIAPRAAEGTPAEELERREGAAKALAQLRALPPREQVALAMQLFEGKSGREIARTLSLSEGYVSKLLARARARIEGED